MSVRNWSASYRMFSSLTPSGKGAVNTVGSRGAPSPFYPRATGLGYEQANRRKSTFMPMLMFALANVAPVCGLVWYFKKSVEERRSELENIDQLNQGSGNDAARNIESICKSSSNCLILYKDQVVPCMPHLPEQSALVLSSDDLVRNVDNTIPGSAQLFDSISATYSAEGKLPLKFIHIAVSPKSLLGKQLLEKKDRVMSLVYAGGAVSDVAVTLKGNITIIEDQRLRKYYWRDRWGAYTNQAEYVLLRLEPNYLRIVSVANDRHQDGLVLVRNTVEGQDWQRL